MNYYIYNIQLTHMRAINYCIYNIQLTHMRAINYYIYNIQLLFFRGIFLVPRSDELPILISMILL